LYPDVCKKNRGPKIFEITFDTRVELWHHLFNEMRGVATHQQTRMLFDHLAERTFMPQRERQRQDDIVGYRNVVGAKRFKQEASQAQ
jgi:hypothetical protein